MLEATTGSLEMSKVFEGTSQNYIKCNECNYESLSNDKFQDITVSLFNFHTKENINCLEKGLEQFLMPYILDGNNKYKCPKCNKDTVANKGTKIISLPEVLMVQLERFTFDSNTGNRVKLYNVMRFPFYIDMKLYIGKIITANDVRSYDAMYITETEPKKDISDIIMTI